MKVVLVISHSRHSAVRALWLVLSEGTWISGMLFTCCASKKHAICLTFFAIFDYLPGFYCENHAHHAFYTAFSVMKLRVNLLFNTKRKPEASIDKTVKDGPDSTECLEILKNEHKKSK